MKCYCKVCLRTVKSGSGKELDQDEIRQMYHRDRPMQCRCGAVMGAEDVITTRNISFAISNVEIERGADRLALMFIKGVEAAI